MLDMGLATGPESQHDPRPRLKILYACCSLWVTYASRAPPAAPGGVKCQCGRTPSHDHISWVCRSGYPRPTQTPSPLAGVFYTHNCRASKFCYCACGVAQHIHEWHSAEELATDVAAPTAQALAAAEVPVEKRGHVRRPTPTGGIF